MPAVQLPPGYEVKNARSGWKTLKTYESVLNHIGREGNNVLRRLPLIDRSSRYQLLLIVTGG